MNKSSPPKYLLRFFRWFCHPELHPFIEGDLLELYEERVMKKGQRKASIQFALDVLLLFRPGIIKPFTPRPASNTTAMLRHNLTITFRHFSRYKTSFAINLIGLSTGLASALLIYLWIHSELSIDTFHQKDTRLYQVMHNFPMGDRIETSEGTPALLAKAIAEEMPEVEHATAVVPPSRFNYGQGIISFNDTHLKASSQFVDQDYFDVFSWTILKGEQDQVLSDKYSVMLSDELANNLFPDTEDIIGKIVIWDHDQYSGSYQISGIFEKPPASSTAQFDILFTYELFFDTNVSRLNLENWGNSNPSTYVALKEGTNVVDFNRKIADFIQTKHEPSRSTLFLQPYSDRYLHSQYENGVVAGGRIEYVRLFSVVGLFILIIAGINFTNLSVARATRRLKEIGVKKSVGAHRKTLIIQFLSDSTLMAFLSLTIALGLVGLLLPLFNEITDKHFSWTSFFPLIGPAFAISLMTGLIAGAYPALYLSHFRPAAVLKGKLPAATGQAWMWKGLVVFQFIISVLLIVGVLIVYQQFEFIQKKNLGYDKESIITFKREGKLTNSLETFLREIKNLPDVVNAATFGHDLLGVHGGTGALDWEGKNPEERIQFANLEGDYGLIELLDIEMVAGRSFNQEFGSDSSKIIFNEEAIAAMGLTDPVGKTITLWGKEREIIGVTKNFHFESLYEPIKPCFIQCYPNGRTILVKLSAGSEPATINRISQFYQDYNQGLPLDYRFLDQDYQALYAAEQRVSTLSKYFASLAIIISCLGLFGLAAFTAERKVKEIGIRKVLGASVFGIIGLLSTELTKMVLIAIIVALPISYLISSQWLEKFAYRVDITWWFFISAGLLTLLVAWTTLSVQSIKAALANPVDSLKNE